MRIAQVNTADLYGGTAKVALTLHRAYRSAGHDSVMIVGYKRSDEPGVISMNPRRRGRPILMLKAVIGYLTQIQYISYPGWRAVAKVMPWQPDVIHLHNLHGNYFDLAGMPGLTKLAPSVLTLHDMWTLTGHCAQSLGCDLWQEGCGHCPHLDVYPQLLWDSTRVNWLRKKWIFGNIGRLWITTPSQWLLDIVADSPILSRFPRRLIPNGVDTSVFSPGSRAEARRELELPGDGILLLFLAAGGPRSPHRGFNTILRALGRVVREFDGQLHLISLGGESAGKDIEDALAGRVIIRGYEVDERRVAMYYRAADVLVYATRADNCPLTVLEAMACGLPVVGSAVGGVPELISEGETGFLVPPGDPDAMATALLRLVRDDELRAKMGANARRIAEMRFGLEKQIEAFMELYEEIMEN